MRDEAPQGPGAVAPAPVQQQDETTPQPATGSTHPRRAPRGAGEAPAKSSGTRTDGAVAGTTDPSTDTGTTPARRRRRRGGRGRGGKGRTGAGASGAGATDGETSGTAEQPEVDLDSQPGEVERVEKAPSGGTRSSSAGRRRGGRGRGGSSRAAGTSDASGSAGGRTKAAAQAGTEETADTAQPVAKASGDATADAAEGSANGGTPARRRRRRGGRGRGRSTASAAAETPKHADDRPPARTRRTRAKTPGTDATTKTQPEVSEPATSTRMRHKRQGRSSVRRRREEMPVVPRVTDKLMAITEHGERDQIAVLEGSELVQHYVTRSGATSMVGNVYLGRVQNVLPGMEAAFVDVGRGRNAVLYAGEVNWSAEDLDGAPQRIEHALKNGQPVLVQVTKDPIGGKGARLTAQLSLPGRFLVLAPNSDVSGISRRLPDDERRRLKTIFTKLKPAQHGLIVRTAAEGASGEALAADLERLLAEWAAIEKRSKRAKAPAVLYEEPELTVRVVRDLFTDEEFRELVTDSPRVFGLVTDYLRAVAPEVVSKVRLHQGPLSAFEEFHIVEQIHKGLDRKVWLPSGGYLVIDRTEALTVIDVNTGKSVGKTNLEETVVNTNVEAAREAARQLRLRDIGGMIVIDFIDMLLEQNKKQVIDAMKEALAQDKSRSQVFDISPLGLLEVTRKRVSGGLLEAFSEPCPTCEGRGLLLTYDVN